jgi:hypothetical protein
MIELNCTYEESKKILELGYDFSSICTKFEYVNKLKDGHAVIYKVGNVFSDGIKFYQPTYGLVMLEGFTPIIPKAALEDCLPEIKESGWYASRNRIQLIYEGGCTDNCQTGIFYLHEMIIKEFESVFEAFIWLHENYAEELKKKFDEVMA